MSGDTRTLKKFAVGTLRSGFGQQPTSTKNSNPAFGFGSSVREHALKQYLSPDHAKVMPGNNSMGPIYKLVTSLGPQFDSKMGSGAMYSFGTETRLPRGNLSSAPGPGAYRQGAATGKQLISTKKSSESVVFGTSTRDQVAKVYMEDADKAFYGLESPGPGAYATLGAVGRQQLSTKETAPGFKLGTSGRFKCVPKKNAFIYSSRPSFSIAFIPYQFLVFPSADRHVDIIIIETNRFPNILYA